jgi:uncharacterized protein
MDWTAAGHILGYTGAALLCLIGFLLSCLSISGSWLVLAAGGLLCWMRWPEYPGLMTLAVLLAICILIEIMEAVASSWGVKKRGGSNAAGWGAMIGGLLGMFAGGLIPIPVIGSLITMMIGSFAGAYLLEYRQMKKREHAAHVATGAVLARIAVIFIKAGSTLGMILILALGLILH